MIPRSRGGESVWENIVASCAPCNRRKGNRLPREIQMHPRNEPKAPGPNVFIRVAAPRIPESWEPYLAMAPAAAWLSRLALRLDVAVARAPRRGRPRRGDRAAQP